MARKNQQALLLAPIEEAELLECLRTIYAARLPENTYKLLAADLHTDIDIVAAWAVGLLPFPPELACGLRVRAAAMKGELPAIEEAALAAMNANLVLRWVSERASRNELIKLFSALAGKLHERRDSITQGSM